MINDLVKLVGAREALVKMNRDPLLGLMGAPSKLLDFLVGEQ